MDTKRHIVKWFLTMGSLGRALTSRRGWINLLFAVVLVGGCYVEREDRADSGVLSVDEIQAVDTTPAQYVSIAYGEDERTFEIDFDKQPINLGVHGAIHYTLLGTTLEITTEKCNTKVIVWWEGGQRTFTDRCPPPPPATEVGVRPRPGSTIPANQQFKLGFNLGVTSATVNGVAAIGSHDRWIVTPGLKEGVVTLEIEWTSRDGSTRSKKVGPYTVRDE